VSLVVERFLICDGENCGENFGVDSRQWPTEKLRCSAKESGWIYRNGKDYCPGCQHPTKRGEGGRG
jgi:hypothetical protein